jgi:arylsulfatase A-like enzyme
MTREALRSPAAAPRPIQFLVLAVWFGLLTGAAQAALLSIKKHYLGQIVRASTDVVWMAPLADVAFALVPAVLFALVAWRWPSRRLLHGAIAVFAFLSFLSVLLLFRQLELYAQALIAAGLAVQTARLIVPRAEGFYRVVRKSLPLVAALVLIAALGVRVWQWNTFRHAEAALAPHAERAPNVLLIVLDTVRARSLSLYGHNRLTTPNLDRAAQTGVVFQRALSTSPWTFPSHASMFTGRWPHELSADWQRRLDDTHPTLAEVLRDRGYITAGFAANTFYCTSEFGMARGFLHYEDYPASWSQTLMSSSIGRELIAFSLNQDFAFKVRSLIGYDEIPGRRNAAQINDAFLSWQARQGTERPFFAFLNYLDAHQPLLPPPPFDTQFRGDAPRGDPRHWWGRQWTPEAIQAETDAYDGAIAYIDHQLGVLMDELRRRGELDNTLIVITSDHGEHFGEHGFMRHGNTLFMEVLHVPLVILFPERITDAVTVPEPVSLRDIPATVLALLNLECGGCLPGRSLTRYWMNDGTAAAPLTSPAFAEVTRGLRVPDRYPNSKSALKSLIVDNLHYIVTSNGAEELYDLTADPRETRNLVGTVEADPALNRLRRQLAAIIQR